MLAAAKSILAATIVVFLLTGLCFSQSSLTVSPRSGPPTTETEVSGSGFSPGAKIHIYFDNVPEGATVANSSGSFSNVAIEIPASATPGEHRVRAETSGGVGAQTLFSASIPTGRCLAFSLLADDLTRTKTNSAQATLAGWN